MNTNRIEREKTIENESKNKFKTIEVNKLNKNDFDEKSSNNSLNNGRTKHFIKYKNPIDNSKKNLKANFLYFDKNNQQFLRHKNWWIPDK